MNPELAEEVCNLVKKPLKWNAIFSVASENAIVPLLDRQLRATVPGLVPVSEMQRLNEANRANALRCLNLTAVLIEILRLLKAEGIAALPYKGPVLAVQAYGDAVLRQFEDVDILLRHRDMEKAHEIMRRLGFVPAIPEDMRPDFNSPMVPGEYKYYGEARAAIVEFHTERTYRHFPVAPDLDELYRAGGWVSLSGHQVRTLSVEDTLVAICVHGSKDFWARLSWIADVSELIQSQPGLDWQRVISRAVSLRAERMLHAGLMLAARTFDTPLPEAVAGRLGKDARARTIAGEMQTSLLHSDSKLRGAIGRFELRRRLVPGMFAGWHYALRLTMVPAEEDWRTMRLPARLGPFYFLLRPLRLARKYGRSHEAA